MSHGPDPQHALERLSDNAAFVLVVYFSLLFPLAFYVYHDIIDDRWRPVWHISRFLVGYSLVYIIAFFGLLLYAVIEGVFGHDYKEVGAAVLALCIGSYGAWKLLRLYCILVAHHSLVRLVQRLHLTLERHLTTLPRMPRYALFRKPDMPANASPRHLFLSSALFDDDYPGASARIQWLPPSSANAPRVLPDDAHDCAMRVALWLRIALYAPDAPLYELLAQTSPLLTVTPHRRMLIDALRMFLDCGTRGRAAPRNMNVANPAERLLRGEYSLPTIAFDIFWISSSMGREEIAQLMSVMPPRWMRHVQQSGKHLIFELVLVMMLEEMPEIDDFAVASVMAAPKMHWKKVLGSLWTDLADVCSGAVGTMINVGREISAVQSVDFMYDASMVRDGIMALSNYVSEQEGGLSDLVGLSLMELVRSSYLVGRTTTVLLRDSNPIRCTDNEAPHPELEPGLFSHTRSGFDSMSKVHLKIYYSELTSGLMVMLLALGLHRRASYERALSTFKEHLEVVTDSWDIFLVIRKSVERESASWYKADKGESSRHWYIMQGSAECEDPARAFFTAVEVAAQVAPFVCLILQSYVENHEPATSSPGTAHALAQGVGWLKHHFKESWLSTFMIDHDTTVEGEDASFADPPPASEDDNSTVEEVDASLLVPPLLRNSSNELEAV